MPKKITIIMEQPLDDGKVGKLGIDDDANLYWNGKKVVTKEKVALEWWVNLSIILGAISTSAIAIFTGLNCLC